ncbi:MAG: VPLPA-CTERM sorting domain-containing protein [Xanthobacteraceae bacterium]
MRRSVWFPLLSAAIVTLSFTAARADTVYDWTISGGTGGLSGSGTITLSSTATITSTGTGYAVDGLTGSLGSNDFATSNVTGPWVSGQVDNLVYPSAPGGTLLDDFGLGIVLANSYDLAVGEDNNNPGEYNVSCCGSNNPIYTYPDVIFALTSTTVSTTPLPATLPLFASGLGALGLLARRRKRKAALAA